MTPRRKLFSFAIDDDLDDGMRALEDRDGIPKSEQIRRALRAFLAQRGVLKSEEGKQEEKAARKRARTRKRA